MGDGGGVVEEAGYCAGDEGEVGEVVLVIGVVWGAEGFEGDEVVELLLEVEVGGWGGVLRRRVSLDVRRERAIPRYAG